MKSYLHRLQQNFLLKISSINALAVLVKVAAGIISSKMIAIFIGAEGLALLGNLRNFVNSLQSLSSAGMYNGVVKYVSEFKKDTSELKKIVSTAFLLGMFIAAGISVVLYVGSGYWTTLLFPEHRAYEYVIQIIAVAVPFYTANTLLLAVINGYTKYKKIISINILMSLLGVLLTVLFIWKLNLHGALMAVVLIPALSFLMTLLMVLKSIHKISLFRFNAFSWAYSRKLFTFAAMALITAILVPFVQIEIRNLLLENYTAVDAGYWEAMQRLSNQYFVFFTTLFTLYLLPKLSKIDTRVGFRNEVFYVYKNILPIFIAILFFIYVFRHWIVRLFLSEDFIPMLPLFKWYLLGDLFKVMSMIISYQFIAKKMFWHFIITEVLSTIVLYLISFYLIMDKGFEGASMAHLCHYIIYFAIILLVFRKTFFTSRQP